jgi:hypothetical protein
MQKIAIAAVLLVAALLAGCAHGVPEGCPAPEAVIRMLSQLQEEDWSKFRFEHPELLWPEGFVGDSESRQELPKECPEDVVHNWDGRIIRGTPECSVTLHYLQSGNPNECNSALSRVVVIQRFGSEDEAFHEAQRYLNALIPAGARLSRSWYEKNKALSQDFSYPERGPNQLFVEVYVAKKATGCHVGFEITRVGAGA